MTPEAMVELGRHLWGDPNKDLSSPHEIRFGRHGSKAIKVPELVWHDHETNEGGGYKDLIKQVNKRVNGNHAADSSISATYDYVDANGALLFQVVRKIPKKFVQRRPDGAGGWVWSTKGVQRVPYRLPELLAADPAEPVFVCEGEKDVDNLRAHGLIATTNPGGAGKWSRALSAHLAGRRVIVLSDNDPQAQNPDGTPRWHPDGRPVLPGQDHAADVGKRLQGIAARVRILMLPDLPPKGDVSDWLAAGGTKVELLKLADAVLSGDDRKDQPAMAIKAATAPSQLLAPLADLPFVPLGHDRGRFSFFSQAAGQVRDFAARDLLQLGSLLELAPLSALEKAWPARNDGVALQRAANDLVQACHRAGVFDPLRLRGRGAWLDDGQVVFHVGSHLLVNGRPTGLSLPKSRHIYEQRQHIEIDLAGEPATVAEANCFLNLCQAVPFAAQGQGDFLAGWCVTAPICGALLWRTHLWLTSDPGAGKSWVFNNIVRASVGPLALYTQSKTSEAGIRQTLGSDARPVIFDEAETQNDSDRGRMQHVLDLARQASSADGADILKGSTVGRPTSYRIASCFAFSSVNLGLSQAADESRTVVVTLLPNRDPVERAAAFADLQKLHAAVMVPGFVSRLLLRTLKLVPTIRQNATAFAEAIARSGRERRTGDTLGTLLAGAWSLKSDDAITPEQADRIVADTGWLGAALTRNKIEPDWQRALSVLIQHRTRFTNSVGRTEEVPIGELIQAATGYGENAITLSDATLALSRMWIRVNTQDRTPHIQIANNNTACANLFKGTPWAGSWRATLRRAPGATDNDNKVVRFGVSVSKVVTLPLSLLTTDEA